MKFIRIEWLKLRTYNTFWILLLLYIITQTLVFYGMDTFKFTFSGEEDGLGMDFKYLKVFSHPDVWHYFAYMAGFFKLILAVLLVLLLNNEFEFKTYRQHIIDGLSRTQNFFLKVGTMTALTLLALVVLLVQVLIFGQNDGDVPFMENAVFAAGFGLEVFGFLSFAFCLTHFLKKTGYVVIVLLIYMIAIEPIIAYKVPEISDYLPLSVFRGMISIPFTKQFGAVAQTGIEATEMIKAFLYACGLIGIAYLRIRKRDL